MNRVHGRVHLLAGLDLFGRLELSVILYGIGTIIGIAVGLWVAGLIAGVLR